MTVKQKGRWACVGIGVGCIALLCSLMLFASRASAVPYAHSEEEADAGSGLVHIAVTLDCSATDGSVKCVWQPVNADGATVEAVMNEVWVASEDKVDRFAHEDYDTQSLASFLSDKTYTVSVYKAGAQQAGASTEYSSESVGGASYAELEKGDAVYITVTE